MKKILSIGLTVPTEDITRIDCEEKISLLDYDIILVNPEIPLSYFAHQTLHSGKKCLSKQKSFELKEDLSHLVRELKEILRAGKTVLFFMCPEETVYAYTGEVNYTGAGRNKSASYTVELVSNYGILPFAINRTNTNGKGMRLTGKADVLKQYWKAFELYSEYKVTMEGKGLEPLVQTRTAEKMVGARAALPAHSGNLLFLPFIDISRDEFYVEDEDDDLAPRYLESGLEAGEEAAEANEEEEIFSVLGKRVGKSFVQAIVEIDNALHCQEETIPTPEWVGDEQYRVGREGSLQMELQQLDRQIKELEALRAEAQVKLEEEQRLKLLLYGTNKALEHEVVKALQLLGFTAKNFSDGTYEFDVLFESPEGRLLGEVEGKDSKPINIDKIRQLAMNVHEEFDKGGKDTMAKGVLFGNACRLQEPAKRGEAFTDRCVTAARTSSIALVNTVELFRVAQYLLRSTDEEFAAACRATLVSATGICTFPQTPLSTADQFIASAPNTP